MLTCWQSKGLKGWQHVRLAIWHACRLADWHSWTLMYASHKGQRRMHYALCQSAALLAPAAYIVHSGWLGPSLHMGPFPQDGILPWFMSFFWKVWKLAVTKPKMQSLFFNCFWKIFLLGLLVKPARLPRHHYTTLHYTKLYPCTLHYTV